jgi:hypothetical protein
MLRHRFVSIALLVAATVGSAGESQGQSLSNFTRATQATGLNDSTLVYVSDSARRSRAAVLPQFRKALSISAFDSIITGRLNLTGGTVVGSPTWSNSQTFGAITVLSCTGCGGGTTYPLLASDGSAGAPSYSFSGASGMGLWRNVTNLGIAVGGTNRVGVSSSGLTVESGRLFNQDGTAAAPGYGFAGESDVGMFRRGLDTLGFSVGGLDTTLFLSYNNASNIANGGLRFHTRASRYFTFYSGSTHSLTINTNGLYFPNPGNASTPIMATNNALNTGLYYLVDGVGSSDTLAIATNGQNSGKFINGAMVGVHTIDGTSSITGGAGNQIITAGTGASRTMTLRTTTSGSATKNTLVLGADSSATFLGSIRANAGTVGGNAGVAFTSSVTSGLLWNPSPGAVEIQVGGGTGLRVQGQSVQVHTGSAAAPSYSFYNSTGLGLYRAGADTLGISTAGTVRLKVATNAATGAGDVALCLTTSGVTNVITQGATCGSSTRKIKTGIASLRSDLGLQSVMALRPVGYNFQPGFYGGRYERGFIADEVARVAPEFAFYSAADQKLANGQTIAKGEALNVNDRAIIASLVAAVQEQQKQIAGLRAQVDSLKRRP